MHFDNFNLHCVISIHALLAESDCQRIGIRVNKTQFLSTLSLRRATAEIVSRSSMFCQFLSTLSLRRATSWKCFIQMAPQYFYPRSPCGERRCPAGRCTHPADISIHALLAESDDRQRKRHPHPLDFYPRSPCGERRAGKDPQDLIAKISIHALLAESDTPKLAFPTPTRAFLSTLSLRRATPTPCRSRGPNRNFYPRSPCGERRMFCRCRVRPR